MSAAAIRIELLVFVEGQTEEKYLIDWHRRHRDRISITVDPFQGGPLQLVEHAVKAQQTEAQEARRKRGRPHDQIWCVFDRDEHPKFDEALRLANHHDIRFAVSNPCIELWFLLHFRDQTAFIEGRDAQHEAKALLQCTKVLSSPATQMLVDRYDEAKQRALRLDEKHRGDASPLWSNPSSGLWKVIDEIRRA